MSSDFNHTYLTRQAKRLGGRVLDFGCGRANVVRLLRADGVDAYGADVFFAGMDWCNDGPNDLIERGVVRAIVNGRLPFADDSFDTVVSDQVIEHVEDLDTAICEMARVLRPEGRMYHQYPTLEVIREAHTAVPWAHRFSPRLRVPYLGLAHRARVARPDVDYRKARLYARHMSQWIDDFCRYRARREIEDAFAQHDFAVAHCEAEYCRSRAQGRRGIGTIVEQMPTLAAFGFQFLGFDCVEAVRIVRDPRHTEEERPWR